MVKVNFIKYTIVLIAILLLATNVGQATSYYKGFPEGYCTYGAAQEFDKVAPNPGVNWNGNAGNWFDNAGKAGWITKTGAKEAKVGAIVVWTGGIYGHVAIVRQVTTSGIIIEEMNYGPYRNKAEEASAITVNFSKFSPATLNFDNLNRNNGKLIFKGYIWPELLPDTTKPIISITSNKKFTTASITVKGTASDNIGLSKVEVKVGSSGTWKTATGTKSWSQSVTLELGSNTIYARATDISGNPSETTVVVTYAETIKPIISITSPTSKQKFTTASVTISGTASDNVGLSKVEVKVGSSGAWQTATGTKSWSRSVTLASGSNTIYARATDTSGNTKETTVAVTYNVPDTTKPIISITSPTNKQTFTTASVTVKGKASDNVGLSKVEVKVGSFGAWQTATGTKSWSKPVTLAYGFNFIYVKATDTSGNTEETSITVTYNKK